MNSARAALEEKRILRRLHGEIRRSRDTGSRIFTTEGTEHMEKRGESGDAPLPWQ
jgi:hypothetical protein